MTTFLNPTPRDSDGLLDGYTDILGGEPLEEPVRTTIVSEADGSIIITAANGGGNVTWVRGVWDAGTTFRYDAYMAPTTNPAATNYMTGGTAANRYIGGVLSTLLTPVGTSPATEYIVYYSRRSGALSQVGDAISGWPYMYVDPIYQGTAEDGDMYVLWALDVANAAFNQERYSSLAARIAQAQLAASRPQGNEIRFDLPLDAESGQVGLYEYYADTTPFTWNVVPKGGGLDGNCLLVETEVLSGGPPYNYAGWGCWQTWSTTNEPFTSIDFLFDGGGCGRNIELSTNAQDDDPDADVTYLVPCLASAAGAFTSFSVTKDDFWRVHNVPWDYQHKEAYYSGSFGTNAVHDLITAVYTTALAPWFTFDFALVPTPVGPELIVNGDFASGIDGLDGWITTASSAGGTVTVSGGVVTLAYVTGRARLRQGVTVEAGKSYLIQFTASAFSGTGACLDIGSGPGLFDYDSNYTCGDGLQEITVTATGTSLWLNFFSDTSVSSYSFDNISIKEVQPAGSAYCQFGIDTAACDSTGTTTLNLNIKPTVTGTAEVRITDAVTTLSTTIPMTADTRVTHAIPWATFGSVTHPVSKIEVEPTDTGTGSYWMLGAWFDSVVRMSDIPGGITAIGGFEFQFPSYDAGGDAYACRFSDVVLNVSIQDGPVSDKTRYVGIPRWTYKWTKTDEWIGYGMWRGWSAPGYLWMAGWTNSGVINPDNGRAMITNIRNFCEDSQTAYQAMFGGPVGPFMPRYGRPSWEALNQEGVVNGALVTNTYNLWYFPWDEDQVDAGLSGDWYGYTYRGVLSCASDYYRDPTPQVKAILDRWIAWFDEGERSETEAITWNGRSEGTYTDSGDPVIGIIWDTRGTDHWHPPSEFVANGKVRYHYNPPYSYACIAQAMLFKYWTDGDLSALKWMRRLLDYLRTEQLTDTGYLAIAMRGDEGAGYTTANVVITGDGTGAAVTAHIFGGKVRYYTIDNAGSGYTYISGIVEGDGTGATIVLALADRVLGAFDIYHTGWEIWEIYNLFAMLIYGSEPGGVVNYPLAINPQDQFALDALEAFVRRNTTDEFPMIMLANGLPIHEYGGLDPYHDGSGIDNPMIRDTHARGAMWTETTGPAFRASVYRQLLYGDTL